MRWNFMTWKWKAGPKIPMPSCFATGMQRNSGKFALCSRRSLGWFRVQKGGVTARCHWVKGCFSITAHCQPSGGAVFQHGEPFGRLLRRPLQQGEGSETISEILDTYKNFQSSFAGTLEKWIMYDYMWYWFRGCGLFIFWWQVCCKDYRFNYFHRPWT